MSTRSRVGSWMLRAPRAAQPVHATRWAGGATWLDAVRAALVTADGDLQRRRSRVAPDTLLRVAAADAATSDTATGSNVGTAHETVALQLGMSAKTVQRARLLLERLGLAVTLVGGRYLTAAERSAAHAAHGGHQVRAASTRALLLPTTAVPRRRPVENVLLPDSRREYRSLTSPKSTPARARARETAAARRSKPRQNHHPGSPRQPRSLPLQFLAARLTERLPWLARGVHIGRVCDVLTRGGVDPTRWDAASLLTELDRFLAAHRVRVLDVGAQRDPLSYFGWMLRRALINVSETPLDRLERERAQRADERQARAAAAAAERARAATMTDAEFHRIKAEMEAQLRAVRAARAAVGVGSLRQTPR